MLFIYLLYLLSLILLATLLSDRTLLPRAAHPALDFDLPLDLSPLFRICAPTGLSTCELDEYLADP